MKDRLGVLDGLRGIAVLLVLWYHLWEISWLPAPLPSLQFIAETGFVGVHLFFFLSGFVIVYPFVRAAFHASPPPTWRHFYYRRLIKIAPSYLLSIAIAYAIGYSAIENVGAPVWKEVITHLLFVHTWWSDTYGSINGVLWTLAVEVEFYALFPLVWWCFARRPIATVAGAFVVATLWRAAFARCCFGPTFSLYAENLPGYLDIFASGMLAAWLFVRYGRTLRDSPTRRAMPALAIAGAIGLLALMHAMYAVKLEPEWQTASQIFTRPLFGLSFAAIALGALCGPVLFSLILDNAALRFMAAISYNLYLYHQIVAREMVRWHVPGYHGDPHADAGWQTRYTLLALADTIGVAALITYAFERPLLRLPEPRQIRARPGHPS